MLKIFSRNKKSRELFSPEAFEEIATDIKNPCRGWYRVFNFNVNEEPDFEGILVNEDSNDTLALILADIGDLNGEELSEEHIARITRIVKFFYENGKNAILRVAYDHEGKAMEREPSFFRQVLSHAQSVGLVLKECEKEIFVYQGLLVGKWGEMHSSRYVNTERLRGIYAALRDCRCGEQFFAVRMPMHWRNLHVNTVEQLGRNCKMGLFNDGMFGSENDLGTYSDISKVNIGWNGPWTRQEENEFQDTLCRYAPNGGEALYCREFLADNSEEKIINEMERCHITYLNRKHDPKLMEVWKTDKYNGRGVWQGRSIYEYVGAHLGYRFLVKKVSYSEDSGKLEITVSNTGFANLYRKSELKVEAVSGSRVLSFEAETGLSDCDSGKDTVIGIKMPPVEGEIYLRAKLISDDRTVYFANTGCDEQGRVRLGHFINN